jgi:hypothetical protein
VRGDEEGEFFGAFAMGDGVAGGTELAFLGDGASALGAIFAGDAGAFFGGDGHKSFLSWR